MEKGHVDVVKELIAEGAGIDSVDNSGWTALMRASASGNIDTVRALIAEGQQIN